MGHLLSIIVPVYNVEEFLPHCLDTILAQSYQDYECILVDDGTKDNAGTICDEYAARDKRFVVIHQENMGLSGARNRGLEIARGDLVAFVDSDDWLEPNMYERMIALIDEHKADIAMCSYQSSRGNSMNLRGIQVFGEQEFTQKVLKDEIGSQLWKFVYKRHLWDGIISPARRHVQDMMVLHRVTHRADCIVTTDEELYVYNDQREENISNNKKNAVKNRMDRALAFLWRLDFAEEHQYDESIKQCLIHQALAFSVSAFAQRGIFAVEFANDVKTVRDHFKRYWGYICREGKKNMLMAWIILRIPKAFPYISILYLKLKEQV